MKTINSKVNAAETKNAASEIQLLLIKVKDLNTGEIKKVDTVEYLTHFSNYKRVEE